MTEIVSRPAKAVEDEVALERLRDQLHAMQDLAADVYHVQHDEELIRTNIMKLRRIKERAQRSIRILGEIRGRVDRVELEESLPTMVELPRFGTVSKVPNDLRKNLTAWSGDKKDKYDIFNYLRRLFAYVEDNGLTEGAAIECMRRLFEGPAATTLHRLCPYILDEETTFLDVVRGLESSFGGLIDAQLAKNRLFTLTREPKETIRELYHRAIALAEMGVRTEPLHERKKKRNELVQPVVIKCAKWEHQKRVEDRIKTRKQAGHKPFRLDDIVAAIEEMEADEQRNPRSDSFVAFTDDQYQQIMDAHEQVMRIVEAPELRRRKEELRGRHPSAARRVDFIKEADPTLPMSALRRRQSRSPGRRSSSRDGRGASGDRRGGRDQRRNRTPSEEVRYASDRGGSSDRRRGRSQSNERRNSSADRGRRSNADNNSRTVRRPSRSPSAYTGAKIDPQELGVSIGSCYKCGSKAHMSFSEDCPYFDYPLTRRCERCFSGGHPKIACMGGKRSGN